MNRTFTTPGLLVCLVPMSLVLGGGNCNENEINKRPIREIAVVSGDFDNMAENLNRMEVGYQEYDGFICCAAYDHEVDPDISNLLQEKLFGGTTEDDPDLFKYDAVFLNSGARGWGAWQYNGIDVDDALLTDSVALDNVQHFVERGGLLVLSDWTYDLVEAIWPEDIQFYQQDSGVADAAQVGALGSVQAKVVDSFLEEKLDSDEVTLSYNYSNWTVIEAVGEGVDVLLKGDIEYRVSASEGTGVATDVPLLFSMTQGSGQVIFSTFHWNAQNPDLADRMMLAVAEGLGATTGGDE